MTGDIEGFAELMKYVRKREEPILIIDHAEEKPGTGRTDTSAIAALEWRDERK